MIRNLALALLVLCTTVTVSGVSFAASGTTKIEVSKTSIDYNTVRPVSDGAFHNGLLFAEQSDGTRVYYNTQGKKAFTLPADTIAVSDFQDQRAVVKNSKTKLYGYINTIGKLAIPCQYTEAGNFSEGVAHVTTADSKKGALINKTGKTVTGLSQTFNSEYHFTNGLASAYDPNSSNKKLGFLNTSGTLAIPYEYSYSRDFSEGLAVVQNNKGLYGFIDPKGKKVIALQYKSAGNFSEGLAPVQNTKGKWGYINTKGKTIIPFTFSNATDFSEGVAAVYNTKGTVGFINKTGQLAIGYQKYTHASSFKEGIALVGIGTNSDGKFGYIDHAGKLLTKLEYTAESSSFQDGYAVAVKAPGKAFILKNTSLTK